MKYSISDAAKVVHKSRSTINRDIRNGKVTVCKDAKGRPTIGLVELERVYDHVDIEALSNDILMTQHDTRMSDHDTTYIDALIQSKDTEIESLKKQLDDMTHRLDASDTERRRVTEQLTGLLTDQRERGRGWWSKLFGR